MQYDSNYDDDDDKSPSGEGSERRFSDFDCPECNANNPVDETFGHGDEVRCNYCGTEYKVKVSDEGKVKFRET